MRLWGHRDFRRLWIGETVSQFGTTVGQLALPLAAILVVHASAFEVGLLTAFETLAFLAIGLPAGAWVDRLRLRFVLIGTDLIRAGAIASVPAAAALHALTIGQLYAVVLVVGVGTVFFDVAYQSYLPELVTRAQLVDGNAKLQASESVAQVAGPGVGGALVQALTAPYALLVDALSFLWSASWVGRIERRPPKSERPADRRLTREIGEGLRFVLGNRILRAIAASTAVANLFSAMRLAVYYVLLAGELHLSAGTIGLISSAAAVGGFVGSLVAGPFARWVGQGPAIWIASLAGAPAGFVVPFAHHGWTLWLLAVSQLGYWVTIVVYNITQVSFRQGLCPPGLLGRMNATMRFLVWGTMPIGALLGGALASWFGVRAALLVAAIGGAVAFVPALCSPLRGARRLPSHDDVPVSEIASPLIGS